jgi:hypothetical protein
MNVGIGVVVQQFLSNSAMSVENGQVKRCLAFIECQVKIFRASVVNKRDNCFAKNSQLLSILFSDIDRFGHFRFSLLEQKKNLLRAQLTWFCLTSSNKVEQRGKKKNSTTNPTKQLFKIEKKEKRRVRFGNMCSDLFELS